MDNTQLATLRAVVGYLGEQGQYAWWPSSFFSSASSAFLNPIFPRLPNQARLTGVARAAQLVHDERIGIGRVYHLFRLPEDVEQSLHAAAQSVRMWENISPHLQSKDVALDYLVSVAGREAGGEEGPVRVGDIKSIRDTSSWAAMAAHFAYAFANEKRIYPYLSDIGA